MCTLSFNPNPTGYSAAMNRDELLARPASLPPVIRAYQGVQTIYPTEPSGGAWIACNNFGNLLALLNWNDSPQPPTSEVQISRGTLIPRLILNPDAASTHAQIFGLDLTNVFPFRLVGIFQHDRFKSEWRWNGSALEQLSFPWARKHWFSSSLSDASAEKQRGALCNSVPAETGKSDWLRELHRSHFPEPGPFSICVHRPDAATVSYTEVHIADGRVSMNYLHGHPCSRNEFDFSDRIPFLESPAHVKL
jgi:hypothetical protein